MFFCYFFSPLPAPIPLPHDMPHDKTHVCDNSLTEQLELYEEERERYNIETERKILQLTDQKKQIEMLQTTINTLKDDASSNEERLALALRRKFDFEKKTKKELVQAQEQMNETLESKKF